MLPDPIEIFLFRVYLSRMLCILMRQSLSFLTLFASRHTGRKLFTLKRMQYYQKIAQLRYKRLRKSPSKTLSQKVAIFWFQYL